jgi:hypothetical protein
MRRSIQYYDENKREVLGSAANFVVDQRLSLRTIIQRATETQQKQYDAWIKDKKYCEPYYYVAVREWCVGKMLTPIIPCLNTPKEETNNVY